MRRLKSSQRITKSNSIQVASFLGKCKVVAVLHAPAEIYYTLAKTVDLKALEAEQNIHRRTVQVGRESRCRQLNGS